MTSKLSISKIKKMPPQFLLRIINKAKKRLKNDPVMLALFKEYDADIEEIDYIPTYFKDLDVSAKTDHGVVWLNYSLLLDGFDLKDYSYLIHEYTHIMQQTMGNKATKSTDNESYLDNEHEQEGFQNQIEFISNHYGDNKAEEYVDDLLDHHDIKDDDKRDELESVFLKNV
jgi:hypothetical protein